MSASTVALLLVTGGFTTYELITYRQAMTHDLSTLAEIIGDRSSAALTFDEKADAEDTLAALRGKKHIRAAALYKGGRVFADYPTGAAAAGLVPLQPQRGGAHFTINRLVLFQEIFVKGAPVGTLYLTSDLEEMAARFKRYGAMALLIFLASSLITYLLSAWLQAWISKPIFHLAATARKVSSEKDYSVRASKQGNDELGQLIDGFNEMLGQIQQRDKALQEANESLEQRVLARTKDLRAEIAERRRAEASLQMQFARTSLINQITQLISERQDTESILHVLLGQLEDHLKLDLGSVLLFDARAQSFNVAALQLKNPLLEQKLDLRKGAVVRLADTKLQPCQAGETVYLPDTLKSPGAFAEKLAGAGLRSLAAVPLLVENKLFGVLLAARLKQESFSSGDCEFLRMLAEHVALAAHQAQLHTQLKSAYDELRQTQQTVMQQERLKALGQLASGIAHDVNNALSPVLGFAELVLTGEPSLSAKSRKALQHVRTAGEDIAHIVARLREFYRRREENESLQKLSLNALAQQVMDMTRPRWRDIPQSHGVTIEMRSSLAAEVPELVGIESEVREALTNLVLNAVDALPQGGSITIRTRASHTPQNGLPYPSHVIVEVSDTGIGMTEEVRKRCLEPFFSTKGKRGTGLGLSMVYGVMERHEGVIEIDSAPGKGSTFRLIFPLRDQAPASAAPEEAGPKPASLHILYIDDEPLLRDLLREMLERDGHQVEVTDGGQTGLDAFHHAREAGEPFDAIITDLGMPYVDGRQVARTVKEESPQTPVIMLTGWGAFMKQDGSAPAQVDGVLSKPPRSRELREMLNRVASSTRQPAFIGEGRQGDA